MSDNSGIQWCDATWNCVSGCTKISAGCDHCYAETFAERWRGITGHHFEQGFDVRLWPDRLDIPLRWKKPRRIFVNSVSDAFHDAIPDDFIARMFAVMAMSPQHIFQVLTKRHGRMRALMSSQEFWRAVGEHGRGIALARVRGE
jgi:protein gp37